MLIEISAAKLQHYDNERETRPQCYELIPNEKMKRNTRKIEKEKAEEQNQGETEKCEPMR